MSTITRSYKDFFKKELYAKISKQKYDGKMSAKADQEETSNVNPESQNAISSHAYFEYVTVNMVANPHIFIQWATSYEVASIIEVTGNQIILSRLLHHYGRMINRSSPYDQQLDWSIKVKVKENPNLDTNIRLFTM